MRALYNESTIHPTLMHHALTRKPIPGTSYHVSVDILRKDFIERSLRHSVRTSWIA
jgi:hypothetical protein